MVFRVLYFVRLFDKEDNDVIYFVLNIKSNLLCELL